MTEQTGQIYALMGKIMAEIGHVGKDSTNAQQNFKYRSIDAVYGAIHPLLGKYGVFVLPEVLSKTREERTNKNGTVLAFTCLRMRYSFLAPDGSHVCCVVEGEGMDSGDKSSNKAMAVAHKYALLQTFCIPTEEAKDPDAEVHEVAAPAQQPQSSSLRSGSASQQPARQEPAPRGDTDGPTVAPGQMRVLRSMLERKGMSEAALSEAFGVESLETLPASRVNDAIAWVQTQEAQS